VRLLVRYNRMMEIGSGPVGSFGEARRPSHSNPSLRLSPAPRWRSGGLSDIQATLQARLVEKPRPYIYVGSVARARLDSHSEEYETSKDDCKGWQVDSAQSLPKEDYRQYDCDQWICARDRDHERGVSPVEGE
jgi:hypothetical protein